MKLSYGEGMSFQHDNTGFAVWPLQNGHVSLNTKTLLLKKRKDNVFEFKKEGRLILIWRRNIEPCSLKSWTLLTQISQLNDSEKLKFVALIDTKKFQQYQPQFPNAELQALFSQYQQVFKKHQRLKTELELLYRKRVQKSFRNITQPW